MKMAQVLIYGIWMCDHVGAGLEDHCNVQVCVRLKPLSFQEVRDGAGRCALAHENTVILDTKGLLHSLVEEIRNENICTYIISIIYNIMYTRRQG